MLPGGLATDYTMTLYGSPNPGTEHSVTSEPAPVVARFFKNPHT